MTKVIAIDGPAAAGKGTLAQSMAAKLDFAYLDTGSLYRAVGIKARLANSLDDATKIAQNLKPEDLTHTSLRSAETGELASQVAVQQGVRGALYDFQRTFGLNPPDRKAGAILDGRDIGTKIFPEADLKLFVTARAEVRARRRHEQLNSPSTPTIDDLLLQVRRRDARDASRSEAPMEVAPDSYMIDTSDMDAPSVLNLALSIWRDSL